VVKIAAEATAVVAYSFGSDYSGVVEGWSGWWHRRPRHGLFDEGAAEMVVVVATAAGGGGEGEDGGGRGGERDGWWRRRRNHITVSQTSNFALIVSLDLTLLIYLFIYFLHYLTLPGHNHILTPLPALPYTKSKS